MSAVPGTQGYERAIELFAEACYGLSFEHVNEDFLTFLPAVPARVLDAGAGVGQNAAALADRGYEVFAIEPLQAFLNLAQAKFTAHDVHWFNDSLPSLSRLDGLEASFDFILVDGVWHHLEPAERETCLMRLFELLRPGGMCALSLRNGPAGLGTHVFPTDASALISHANKLGFEVMLHLKNQSSKMPNKPKVKWDRLVLAKRQSQ